MGLFDNPSALSTLEKGIGILITAFTGWAAIQSSLVKSDLEALNKEIASNADQRETRKLNHEINFKIYEEIKDVYRTPNLTPDQVIARLTAIMALVEPNPQSEVRSVLTAAIKSALDNVNITSGQPSEELLKKTEAAKDKIDMILFKADEAESSDTRPKDSQRLQAAAKSASADKPKWANYDFDFFWCEKGENPDANKRAAVEASKLLQSLDPNADGRWRVRMLPAAINAKPGYRIDGYRINVSSDDEAKIATVMDAIFKHNAMPSPDINFEIRRINYPTPWYLSVFFCPGGLAGSE